MSKLTRARAVAVASVAALVPALAISLAGTAAAAPRFTAQTDLFHSVQIYECDAATRMYKNVRPEATLVTPDGKKITHGAGPKWTAPDGSSITATVVEKLPQKDQFTIPELVLKVTANNSAPGTLFAGVTTVRRTNTVDGISRGFGNVPCTPGRDGTLSVPYEATYVFE